jgi:hypothetical protein
MIAAPSALRAKLAPFLVATRISALSGVPLPEKRLSTK